MKQLQGSNTGPQWNSTLLHDLVFIKQHLRYPFSEKTLPKTFIVAFLLIIGARMMGFVFLAAHSNNLFFKLFIIPLLVVIIIGSFYQYYRTLQFRSIPTPFFAAENTKLIEVFLRSQQLMLYQHPDAPEVFQIASRAIGGGKNPQREIMIFIADDKRVLINSHFVNQKYTITPASRNAGKMANRLQEYIKIHCTTPRQDVVHL